VSDTAGSHVATLPDDATAEAASQARHQLRVGALTLAPFVVGVALLWLEPEGWLAEAWTSVAMVALGAIGWIAFGRGARQQSLRLLAEYAVMHHVDPGPGRREAADDEARRMVWGRIWGPLLVLVFYTPHLILSPWDDPTTAVPGALLVALSAAFVVVDRHRQAAAGRRWLTDPPRPAATTP
jgi:hypothetical protein